MNEAEYQQRIITRLGRLFPGSLVLKNDPTYVQGIPDLVIFYEDRWGMLEVKTSMRSRPQPNQEHYVDRLNAMSFAAFIYPENEEEVLDALQFAFGIGRQARLFEPKHV
jgi:hypothetical protein